MNHKNRSAKRLNLAAVFILVIGLISSLFFIQPLSASDLANHITIAEVTGGIAIVTTDAADSQATPGTTVTVSVAVPDNESQYNHQFKSITVTGTSEAVIPTTEVAAGQIYAFIMPSEAVTVTVELEIVPLSVYVLRGSSEDPVLVHTYTQAELEALSIAEPQYYTGIDSMPSVIQGKGIGVLLSTLIDDLKQYDAGVSFGEGAVLKLSSADDYSATYTYNYLMGAPRYYYPNLNVNPSGNNQDISNAAAIEPMFCITSFQGRNLTRQALDAYTPDNATTYRFCFGLLPSDVATTTVTVNRFAKWVNRIDIIGSASNITDSNIFHITTTLDNTTVAAPGQAAENSETLINRRLMVGLIAAAIVIIGCLAYFLWWKKR